jgi:orotate phosphoribosyltransferase
MNGMSYRDELLNLLVGESLKRGEFTLASGQKSDYYINGKLSTLNSRGAFLTARIFLAMISDDVPDAVGGMTLGADPIVGSMLALAGMEDLALKGFIVRKATKDHGTRTLVEGPLAPGDRVVVIEDVVTTGSSSLRAVEAIKDLGCDVSRVLAVVDREQGGRENLRKAGLRLEAIFTANDLLAV